MPSPLGECEINPLVLTAGGPVALDVLVKLGDPGPAPPAARPLHKLRQLLEPSSVAIVGVSQQMNPGHIILNNLLREGFARERIFVVKPRATQIEGCRCVPDVASLPGRVDLLVLAVAAAQHAYPDLPPLRSAQVAYVGPSTGDVEITPLMVRAGKSSAFISVGVTAEAGPAAQALEGRHTASREFLPWSSTIAQEKERDANTGWLLP